MATADDTAQETIPEEELNLSDVEMDAENDETSSEIAAAESDGLVQAHRDEETEECTCTESTDPTPPTSSATAENNEAAAEPPIKPVHSNGDCNHSNAACNGVIFKPIYSESESMLKKTKENKFGGWCSRPAGEEGEGEGGKDPRPSGFWYKLSKYCAICSLTLSISLMVLIIPIMLPVYYNNAINGDNVYYTNSCDVEYGKCRNYGLCQNSSIYSSIDSSSEGYTCICPPYYSGKFCHNRPQECRMNLFEAIQAFFEWMGGKKYRQKEGPLCTTETCQNGGTLLTDPDQCICTQQYKGKFCEIKVLACDSDPCPDDTTCVNTNLGYQCRCTKETSPTEEEYCNADTTFYLRGSTKGMRPGRLTEVEFGENGVYAAEPWYDSPAYHRPQRFTSHGRDVYVFFISATTGRDITLSLSPTTDTNTDINKDKNTDMKKDIGAVLTLEGARHKSTTTFGTTILVEAARGQEWVLEQEGENCCARTPDVTSENPGPSGCCGGRDWGGFSLTGTMDPAIAVSAASRGISAPGRVPLTQSSMGAQYMHRDEIVVPVDGTYYLSFSCSLNSPLWVRVDFIRNQRVVDQMHFSTGTNETRPVTSGTLQRLFQGDRVSVNVTGTYSQQPVVCTDVRLVGFLYSPLEAPPAAWYMQTPSQRSPTFGKSPDDVISGASIMSGVTVYLGETSELRIRTSGLYYLQLSAECYCNYRKIKVYRQGAVLMELYHSAYSGGFEAITTQYISPLLEGDTLTVQDHEQLDKNCQEGKFSFLGFKIRDYVPSNSTDTNSGYTNNHNSVSIYITMLMFVFVCYLYM